MAIKERKAKIDKKTGQISTVKIALKPIMWYLQFVKLLVDLEQAKFKLRVNRKLIGGQGGRMKTNYIDVPVKIDKKSFNKIDLNYFKKMPSFLNAKFNANTGQLLSKDYLNKFRKWFEDNKHLYEDYSVRYVKNLKDLTQSDDYFTVQVPKSLSRLERANQIDMLRQYHEIKREELKPAEISLLKPLGDKAYDRLFRTFLLRYHQQTWNEIAQHLKYAKSGDLIKMKNEYGKDNYKQGGIASAQRTHQNCNHLLYNLQQNIFPKTTA